MKSVVFGLLTFLIPMVLGIWNKQYEHAGIRFSYCSAAR